MAGRPLVPPAQRRALDLCACGHTRAKHVTGGCCFISDGECGCEGFTPHPQAGPLAAAVAHVRALTPPDPDDADTPRPVPQELRIEISRAPYGRWRGTVRSADGQLVAGTSHRERAVVVRFVVETLLAGAGGGR